LASSRGKLRAKPKIYLPNQSIFILSEKVAKRQVTKTSLVLAKSARNRFKTASMASISTGLKPFLFSFFNYGSYAP
jgi:hypothetical protein